MPVLWQTGTLHRLLPLSSSKKTQLTIKQGTNGESLSKSPQHLILSATVNWRDQCPVAALLDSEENFIDSEFVKQLGIPMEPFENPLEARSLNGLKLFQVTHRTVPIALILSGNHCKEMAQ